MSWQRWTPEEDKIVRQHYLKDSPEKLRELLPRRTWDAIVIRGSVDFGLHRRSIWKLRRLSKTEAAWLAATIDGEGYLRLSKQRGKDKFIGRLVVDNTNLDFIKRVKEVIGYGTILTLKDHPQRTNIKLMNRYTLAGLRAISVVLEQIYPYLIIKKKKAKIMIRAGKLIAEHNRVHQQNNPKLEKLLIEFDKERYSKGISRKRAEANLPASGLEGWRTS